MSDPETRNSEWLTTRTFHIVLAAALLAAFPEIALGVRTLFFRDFGALGYPGAFFTRDCLLKGELPLWNPYSHCGVPWLAQMGQWYLPAWLCYLLPLPWAANFLILAHLWFGGFGMFWLLRRWKVGNFPAAFAAFAFVFNGVTLSCTQWGNYIASLAWLPWVVGSTMAGWRNGGRWLPFAAGAAAMQVLTATPEITLLTWGFIGFLGLGEIFNREIKLAVFAGRICLIIIIAAGLTMIQMLPFFDLLEHSQRGSGTGEASVWAIPAWGWANLIVPLFHCYQSPQGIWCQHGQDFLISYYLGLGVVLFGIVGVFTRSRHAILIAAMILFCLLAASGTNGFLYGPLKKLFPLIGFARFPVKFMILPAFLAPLLAALGLDELSRSKRLQRVLGIAAGVILIVAGGLLIYARRFPDDDWDAIAGNAFCRIGLMVVLLAAIAGTLKIQRGRAQMALQIILLAILPLDAFTHNPGIAPSLPSPALAPGIWQATGKPAVNLGQGRIMVSPNAEQELLYSRVTDIKADFIGKRLAEWYNLNLLDSLPKVTGAVTLRPASFDQLEGYLYYTSGGHCGRGLVDFLSVAWLSSEKNPTTWLARTNYLPCITAGQKPFFVNDATALQAITANDFDPRDAVYLPDAARTFVTVTNQSACSILNTRFSANGVDADVQAPAPALVVMSQSYYHLWRAFVDGTPARLSRANLAFQAVEIPSGKHHIQWQYQDPYLEVGAIISVLSLALCVLIYFRPRSRGSA